MAERFSTNASTLNRELRNISGYNFAHTLNRVRVNIASGALLYEDMSLSYVAEHSGFSSEVAFYRIFKKYTGTTPLEYRKQMLESGEKVYRGMIMSQMLMDVLNHSYASFSSPIDIKDTSKSPLSVRERYPGAGPGEIRRVLQGHHRPYKAASCCSPSAYDESSGAGCGGKCRVQLQPLLFQGL